MPYLRRMAALLVLLVGTAFLTAMVWRPAPPPRFVGVNTQDVPRSVNGYNAPTDDEVAPDVKAALSSADLISRTYLQNGAPLNFTLIGGTDRTALHDPRSCLVGAGWRLENDHTELLPGAGISIHACRAVGSPGQAGMDILYVYVVDGRIIDQVTQIRAAMLWSALLGRKNTPVYFLRFSRPLSDDAAQQADRHAQIEQFAARMWISLRSKITPEARL